MSTTYVCLFRAAMSIALLTLAWHLVDGEALLLLLSTMDIELFFVAVAITLPMHILSAARWRFTCARIGMALPFGDALREYYLASLLNTVLPGGIAGDAARVWRQAKQQNLFNQQIQSAAGGAANRYRRPLHGVLVERFAGQCALFLVLGVGIASNWQRLAPVLDRSITIAVFIALVAAVCWLLVTPRKVVKEARWRRVVRQLRADARRALMPLPVLLLQTALSLAIVASYLAIFWVSARAVHAPLDAASALVAIPLVLTAMTLPISVGGLGLRETTAAVLWPMLSLSASDGAASALTYGAAILVGALPGVVVLLRRLRPQL